MLAQDDESESQQQFTDEIVGQKNESAQAANNLADLEDPECRHADSFDMGKHHCKA